MVGTWDVKAALRDCQTGACIKTFRVVNTFGCDGTVIETGARNEPSMSSPGQGTWRHIGGQNYCAILRYFRFNADGTVAGTQKVTRHIELSDDGIEFTATASIEVFDNEDCLIQTDCATETGRQLE
jgi:hypothetical protein